MISVSCKCGGRFKAKPEWAGKSAKCPKCGDAVRIVASAAEDDLYSLADGPAVEAPRAAQPPQPVAVDYTVHDRTAREHRRSAANKDDAAGLPKRPFRQDVMLAFAWPFSGISHVFNTLLLMALGAGWVFFETGIGTGRIRMGLTSLIGWVAIYGWLASSYMNVILETASGSDDMPGVSFSVEWWDDILRPAIVFTISLIIAMAPLVIYVFVVRKGIIGDSLIVLGVWGFIGVMCWPMTLLLFAADMPSMLAKPALVVTTIIRTIGPYLLICAALVVTLAARVALARYVTPAAQPPSVAQEDDFFARLGARMLSNAAGVFAMLVCMRLIGLYYLHYKQRFAFEME